MKGEMIGLGPDLTVSLCMDGFSGARAFCPCFTCLLKNDILARYGTEVTVRFKCKMKEQQLAKVEIDVHRKIR